MKIDKINIRILILLVTAGMLIMNACKKEEIFPRTRLFQPVLNEDLYSIENTIVIDLGKMKEALNYTIEISRDSFLTVDYEFNTDTSFVIINDETVGEELLWFTLYQVRATAHADDPDYNSLPSFLGSVRTQKFPSNMGTPTEFDVLDNRARVFWTPSGEPITGVKVFDINDLRLEGPALMEFEVSEEERMAAEKIISGLDPETSYQVAIFSEDKLRGWEIYQTKEPLVSGDNVVDLTGMDSLITLSWWLPDVEDGSIILLEGGKTYMAGGYDFDKSISFMSGYSFTPALPIIDCESNFNLLSGSNVGYVHFKNIYLMATRDGYNARYVFNINVSASLGELKFESCVIHGLRGVTRMKDKGPGTLDMYTIHDCRIDSIRDYGLLTVDKNSWICNEISITNTTVSKAVTFMTSRNNSNSIIIDGCTFNEMPEQGRPMFRWRESGQNDVLNGISISNTIWGQGWNLMGDPNYVVDGFDGMENTTWIVVNTYTTSDFGYEEGGDEIPGFPSFEYSGTAADLWTNPYNAIFDFKDTGFAGRSDAGDPRWWIGP